jgi:hypothetical protein
MAKVFSVAVVSLLCSVAASAAEAPDALETTRKMLEECQRMIVLRQVENVDQATGCFLLAAKEYTVAMRASDTAPFDRFAKDVQQITLRARAGKLSQSDSTHYFASAWDRLFEAVGKPHIEANPGLPFH